MKCLQSDGALKEFLIAMIAICGGVVPNALVHWDHAPTEDTLKRFFFFN